MICKSCGSEVSPYITECPYCGNRLRKRAPKLDRDGRVAEAPPPPSADSVAAAPARGEIPGIRAGVAPVRDDRARAPRARRLPDLAHVAAQPERSRRRRATGGSLVAALDCPVHLRQHRLCVRGARHDRAVRLAARAPSRSASDDRAVPDRRRRRDGRHRGGVRRAGRARRQRRRARAARRVGDPRSALAARRRGDRRATCSARP